MLAVLAVPVPELAGLAVLSVLPMLAALPVLAGLAVLHLVKVRHQLRQALPGAGAELPMLAGAGGAKGRLSRAQFQRSAKPASKSTSRKKRG